MRVEVEWRKVVEAAMIMYAVSAPSTMIVSPMILLLPGLISFLILTHGLLTLVERHTDLQQHPHSQLQKVSHHHHQDSQS